jgi:hypothetical protein
MVAVHLACWVVFAGQQDAAEPAQGLHPTVCQRFKLWHGGLLNAAAFCNAWHTLQDNAAESHAAATGQSAPPPVWTIGNCGRH